MTTVKAPQPEVPFPDGVSDSARNPLSGLGAKIVSPGRWARRRPAVRMVPSVLRVGTRHLHYAVSDNLHAHGPEGPDSPPVWAVNVHGYFASGRMYWRESAHLAEQLGWRVVNPCLPGFGGSDPLGWHEVSIGALAEQLAHVVDHLGAGPVVLLGHSMGGAVAVQYAHQRPEQTLGIIYRDGVATPAWRDRRGTVHTVMGVFSPNVAPLADLVASFFADAPDMLLGRMGATFLTVLPEVRQNFRTAGLTLPIGAMLMTVDLRGEVASLTDAGVPILAEWGSFDRIVGPAAADEFSRCARTTVQWLPGGHSWMLARPQGQADVLTRLASGRRFMAEVHARHRELADETPRSAVLRSVR